MAILSSYPWHEMTAASEFLNKDSWGMLLVMMEPLAKRLGAFFRRNEAPKPTTAETDQLGQQPPEHPSKDTANSETRNFSQLQVGNLKSAELLVC